MIASAQEVEQSIKFVSTVLDIMRLHSDEYNIEFIYKGFGVILHEFESRVNKLISEYNQAIQKNSIEDWNDVNIKVLSKC